MRIPVVTLRLQTGTAELSRASNHGSGKPGSHVEPQSGALAQSGRRGVGNLVTRGENPADSARLGDGLQHCDLAGLPLTEVPQIDHPLPAGSGRAYKGGVLPSYQCVSSGRLTGNLPVPSLRGWDSYWHTGSG